LRVQKTKAATSSFRRETSAGLPEYGFRYSALPASMLEENPSGKKAGMSVRRDALMMTGGSRPYSITGGCPVGLDSGRPLFNFHRGFSDGLGEDMAAQRRIAVASRGGDRADEGPSG
jgi:hypothetical protein